MGRDAIASTPHVGCVQRACRRLRSCDPRGSAEPMSLPVPCLLCLRATRLCRRSAGSRRASRAVSARCACLAARPRIFPQDGELCVCSKLSGDLGCKLQAAPDLVTCGFTLWVARRALFSGCNMRITRHLAVAPAFRSLFGSRLFFLLMDRTRDGQRPCPWRRNSPGPRALAPGRAVRDCQKLQHACVFSAPDGLDIELTGWHNILTCGFTVKLFGGAGFTLVNMYVICSF